VLGESTLAARLPFVLLGFLTIPCTYLLARRAFGSLAAARWSALFLATSVPFLLHARQARWYAPAYLLVACLLLAFLGLAQGRRFSLAAFVVSAVLLFYTNLFIAIGLLAAVLVSAPLLLARRAFFVDLFKAYALVALLTLPGIWLFDVFDKGGGGLDIEDILFFARRYVGLLFTFLLPLPLVVLVFLPLPARGSWCPAGGVRKALFFSVMILLYVCYLCLAPWMMPRYLFVVLPLTAVLIGFAMARVWAMNRWVAAILAMIVIGTNALHLVPLGLIGYPGTTACDTLPLAGQVTSPLAAYCCEITQPIHAPEAAVVDYLWKHGRKDDVVIATYGDLVFQFYLKRKVAGGLQGRPLPKDPDWVVVRGFTVVRDPAARKDGWVKESLKKDLNMDKYEEIDLGEDYFLENNPDPFYHYFRHPDPVENPVRLLRKKE
jgi:hypothetical protein